MEVMEFQLSYFKYWKMMLWKCCSQYASKSGKCSSGHRTGKGQFSFQSQRKAMPKNAQTTTQMHSWNTLRKVMLKILQARPQHFENRELPDVQAGFREGWGNRDKTANICWIIEKAREFQKNFCFIASLVALMVENPPAMWETWVQSLGWEGPLEKGIVTHFIIIDWRIPGTA